MIETQTTFSILHLVLVGGKIMNGISLFLIFFLNLIINIIIIISDIGFRPSVRNSTDGFTCTPSISNPPPQCATGYILIILLLLLLFLLIFLIIRYRLIPATNCTIGLDIQSKDCVGYSGRPIDRILF